MHVIDTNSFCLWSFWIQGSLIIAMCTVDSCLSVFTSNINHIHTSSLSASVSLTFIISFKDSTLTRMINCNTVISLKPLHVRRCEKNVSCNTHLQDMSAPKGFKLHCSLHPVLTWKWEALFNSAWDGWIPPFHPARKNNLGFLSVLPYFFSWWYAPKGLQTSVSDVSLCFVSTSWHDAFLFLIMHTWIQDLLENSFMMRLSSDVSAQL